MARDKHVIIVGGGSHCYSGYRSYPSYSHSYYSYRPSYYYSRPYVSYYPSVSLSYSSAPRTYARSYDYDNDGSLEADVQRALKRRGYYDGAVDGDIGPGSRSAIRAYQYDHGLSATGRIDSALLRNLGL